MDRNETYSYFKHDKIDAWDYLDIMLLDNGE